MLDDVQDQDRNLHMLILILNAVSTGSLKSTVVEDVVDRCDSVSLARERSENDDKSVLDMLQNIRLEVFI